MTSGARYHSYLTKSLLIKVLWWRRPCFCCLAVLLVIFSALVTKNTRAQDRFTEIYSDEVKMVDLKLSLLAFNKYIAQARLERTRRKNYSADYFAKRAYLFGTTGRQPKFPNLFDTVLVLTESQSERFEVLAESLTVRMHCFHEKVIGERVIEALIRVESTILDTLVYRRGRLHDTELDRLLQLVNNLPVRQKCEVLDSVSQKATPIDWDINLASSMSKESNTPKKSLHTANEAYIDDTINELSFSWSAEDVPDYFFQKGISAEQTLDPCVIDVDQRSVYFDIDATRSNDLIASALLSGLVSSVTNSSIILVEGHADSAGPGWRNLQLAEGRAREVAKELARIGLRPAQLRLINVGAYCPQRYAGPDVHIKANRRVTIKILRENAE